jgi:hypothetical protein
LGKRTARNNFRAVFAFRPKPALIDTGQEMADSVVFHTKETYQVLQHETKLLRPAKCRAGQTNQHRHLMKTLKTIKSKTKKTIAKTPAVSLARKTTVKAAAKAPAAPVVTPRREITSECIAARAYSLWEQQGRPHGRDLELWLQAEKQLKASQSLAA